LSSGLCVTGPGQLVDNVFDLDRLLSHGPVAARRLALDVAEHALKAVDPFDAVMRRMHISGQWLHVDERSYDLDGFEHIYVAGGGKACYPQALAIQQLLGDRITDGFISVKRGQERALVERMGRLDRIRVAESAHPTPDESSLRAGLEILALADGSGERDLVLCLMSGGTSAQVIAPVPGVSVADKAVVNQLMITSGADITEVMTVRGHLSRIKCGGLARRLHPATVIACTVSDEKTDSLLWNTDFVSHNGTRPADAIAILKQYGLWQRMPRSVRKHLAGPAQAAPPAAPVDGTIQRCMVIRTADLFAAATGRARELGLNALPLTSLLCGESRDVGRTLASIAREVVLSGRPVAAPCALIATGETAVSLRSELCGEGGPNQELAVGACLDLALDDPIAVLAMDTDGTDGPTEIAGGLTDAATRLRAQLQGVNLRDCLRRHDSSRALRAAGDAVVTGPTGTNVNDLVVIVAL